MKLCHTEDWPAPALCGRSLEFCLPLVVGGVSGDPDEFLLLCHRYVSSMSRDGERRRWWLHTLASLTSVVGSWAVPASNLALDFETHESLVILM